MNLLDLEELSCGYRHVRIVDGATFPVLKRDFLGIIGPNGGGKTTLIKTVLGLLKPLGGAIRYPSGKPITGYLPQISLHDRAFPILCRDVVLSGLLDRRHMLKPYTAADRERAAAVMERMGVAHLAARHIGTLSGGQMQRVFLARAIISEPELLILDEPDTFVDAQFSESLYGVLKELNESMAIIVVSHDIGTILDNVKNIACVNGTVHYHSADEYARQITEGSCCPVRSLAHGKMPHTVLREHD